MPNIYDLGETVRMRGTFTDVSGSFIDPTVVYIIVDAPTAIGTAYTYASGSVTRNGTGLYHYDYTVGTWGYYSYAWIGSGPNSRTDDRLFVRTPQAGTL